MNIKSIYILKEIFKQMIKKKYLDLISYNKKLKCKLEINIEDYKNEAKKIKSGQRNGFGKEYKLDENNILLFEGEYLNGKRNGKGKEYFEDGKLKFEGEYFKGKRIEGREYDIEGNEIHILERNGNVKRIYEYFKGEYYNGKIWNGKIYNKEGKEEFEIRYGTGKVKEYDEDWKLKFEGEYFNGERNGKGKEYNYNKFGESSIFEGEFLNGKRHNKCKGFFPNGKLAFEGEYIDGEKNGIWKEYFKNNNNIKFEGEYLKGKKWNGKGQSFEIINGKGILLDFNDDDELLFKGEYLNGEKNGKGEEYYFFYDDWMSKYIYYKNFCGNYLNGISKWKWRRI